MLDWSIRGKEEEEEEKKANLEEVGKENFEAAVKGAMRSGRQMVLTA